MEVEFGSVSDFLAADAVRHEFEGSYYWVVSADSKIRAVLQDKCAHMGSGLRRVESGFVCPSHRWTYGDDGRNLIPGNGDVTSLAFRESKGRLLVRVLDKTELLPDDGTVLEGTESLDLLTHASFLLRSGNTRLLFDPWLIGDTYWGSWRHWPANHVSSEVMDSISHIAVTHPHPDHFHLPTFARLSRTLPVYFPPFLSQIIPRELESLGFKNLYEVGWEHPVKLDGGVSFAFLRPTSVWEDSAVLVRVRDWIWLNQNDAGAPLRDDLIPQPINLLSSSFDVGASGYPQMWGLPKNQERQILRATGKQILKTINERCERTGALFFAPFASWWRHVRTEHEAIARELPHNSMDDVDLAIRTSGAKLLRTEPGTSVNLKTMILRIIPSSAEKMELGSPTTCLELLNDVDLSERLQKQLTDLATNPIAAMVERVDFEVRVEGVANGVSASFGMHSQGATIKISAQISREAANLLVNGDSTVTWNHLDIGWWVRWSRSPNIYPTRFMRLLQLGAFENPVPIVAGSRDVVDGLLDTAVAELIEISPTIVPRVLDRAGLPCVGCSLVPRETLREAFLLHNVGLREQRAALSDLNALVLAGEMKSTAVMHEGPKDRLLN